MKSPVLALQEKRRALVLRFRKGEAPGFVEEHTGMLDEYFQESFARSSVGPRMHMEKNPCALVALGGYGRKEQCLHSDVDVLLLFGKRVPPEANELIQEIFYPLWDIGLDVGHSTRSLRECTRLAAEDFEVFTSMIDARFLCGISSLYSDLMAEAQDRLVRRRGRALLGRLAETIQRRHAHYGDSAYLLEPNLKEGLGGLRDYHSIRWIAWCKYRLKEADELVEAGHLAPEEMQGLLRAVSFLWVVRNRLHMITGRKCDQLYFEHQVQLARDMGFEPARGQQAVERFLGEIHGHMEFVKHLHRSFLNKAMPRGEKPYPRKILARLRIPGLRVHRDALHFESPEAVRANPLLLIRIFEQSALLGVPLSIEAARLVRRCLPMIDEAYRNSAAVVHSIQRILVAPPQIFNALNEMLNTGILIALLPEMAPIVHRIQYDEYHVHPVDKHSLLAVRILKGLADPASGQGGPLYAQLFREMDRPELVLWAALLHDVGKGVPGRDHSEQGAEIARTVLERMGLSADDIDTVCFLVREHLSMVKTATQRDLQDEKLVVQFARKFRDVDRLRMLYLLTVADCIATGPKAWNSWTEALLRELFFKAHLILRGGELATRTSEEIVEKKRAEVFREARFMDREKVETLFENMSPRYLLYTRAGDIVRHLELFQMLGDAPFVIDPGPPSEGDFRTVTVCARDRPGLFATFSGVFTLNNLDILNANIYTWRNRIALDVFTVRPPPDSLREDQVWRKVRSDLHAALAGSLVLEDALREKLLSCRRSRKAGPRRPDRVVVDNESSGFFTIVEVHTHDYPGLLYKITNALFRMNLNVVLAKIATNVDQVVDIFYVRDEAGQKLDGAAAAAGIGEALGKVLRNGPGGSDIVV
jgi:[protein-PII] uridylyltransferase